MVTRQFEDDPWITVARLRDRLDTLEAKALRRAGRLPVLSSEDPPQPVSDSNDEEWVTASG